MKRLLIAANLCGDRTSGGRQGLPSDENETIIYIRANVKYELTSGTTKK